MIPRLVENEDPGCHVYRIGPNSEWGEVESVEKLPLAMVLDRKHYTVDYNPTTGVRLDIPIFDLTHEHQKWCDHNMRHGIELVILRELVLLSEKPYRDHEYQDYFCIQFKSERDYVIYKLYWG